MANRVIIALPKEKPGIAGLSFSPSLPLSHFRERKQAELLLEPHHAILAIYPHKTKGVSIG